MDGERRILLKFAEDVHNGQAKCYGYNLRHLQSQHIHNINEFTRLKYMQLIHRILKEKGVITATSNAESTASQCMDIFDLKGLFLDRRFIKFANELNQAHIYYDFNNTRCGEDGPTVLEYIMDKTIGFWKKINVNGIPSLTVEQERKIYDNSDLTVFSKYLILKEDEDFI